ncbi:unnamed protein product [Pleuronectes platessa]|uniref:Uncharacterized protein n=1 Tax=Pleuronectes platessa TaxID=8262 RepID=A0A9N7TNM0_PLEPL|nr:unnamed protein product [Pleuronectes platessa]
MLNKAASDCTTVFLRTRKSRWAEEKRRGLAAGGIAGCGVATDTRKELPHFLATWRSAGFFSPPKVFASRPTAHHGPHLCVAVLPL